MKGLAPTDPEPGDQARAGAAQSLSKAPGTQTPVGYLINRRDGLTGSQGLWYDYVWAENGLFVQSQNQLITARSLISPVTTKGLNPTEEKLELPHGPIPRELLEEGLRWMLETPETERFFTITLERGAYHLTFPDQQGNSSAVNYTPSKSPTIAEFHSHGPHQARFSATDDQDEQAFRIYGVIGPTTRPNPQIALRVGIYGNHRTLHLDQVFTSPTESTD